MRGFLAAVSVTALSFFAHLNAHMASDSVSCAESKRVYIALDQLWLDQTGIFVSVDGNVLQASALFHDENGMYVIVNASSDRYCGNGHLSPQRNGYCAVSWCRYYDGVPYGARPQ